MADVSAKFGVSGISQFRQGMNDAAAAVKGIDAALKLNEKQLKANGKAEDDLVSRTELLNRKLEAQKTIVKNAEQALKQMEQNGVKQTSKAYQDMQTRMIEAQSAMLDTQQQLEGLGSKATEASGKTDKLVTSLGGLNKKVSLEQVIGVVDKLTGGLERAGKKAVDVGKQIWENIIDTAKYSDDIATAAMTLDMTPEEYQKYKGVFDTVGEITVQEWQKAKQKVQKAVNDPTQEQTDLLTLLGIPTHEILQGKMGAVEGAARDFETVFWEIGAVLKRKVESGELTQDLADTYANTLLGKGYAALKPMWDLGAEGFEEALKVQEAASNEAIQKNAELNDAVTKLQSSFTALKTEVLGGMAPALTGAAQSLDGMLSKLMEYLKSEDGQKLLDQLGTAVAGLFEDLSEIDPQKVVEGFSGVFNTIVGGLQWLDENKQTVIDALKAVVIGWGALELGGAVLDLVKLIEGIQGLTTGGAAAGAAAGASWGGAFAAAVLAAAPWLLALLATKAIPDENKIYKEERVQAAETSREEIERLIKWVELQNEAAKLTNKFGTNEFDESRYEQVWREIEELGKVQEGDLWGRYWDYLVANDLKAGEMPTDVLQQMLDGLEPLEIPSEAVVPDNEAEKIAEQIGKVVVEPEVPDNEAEKIAAQIGTVIVHADVIPTMTGYVPGGGGNGGNGRPWLNQTHANGLWSVPFDGYMAVLHKGERIVPAREVESSRNFTTNTYFENVNIQNGTDADGLAARVAAEQRRTINAFGG